MKLQFLGGGNLTVMKRREEPTTEALQQEVIQSSHTADLKQWGEGGKQDDLTQQLLTYTL